MESVGDCLEQTVASLTGQTVEMWGVGMLQQCFAAQLGQVPVGHAVAQYDKMFH